MTRFRSRTKVVVKDRAHGRVRMLESADQMSLVRLLLYSNQLDVEGLVATTTS